MFTSIYKKCLLQSVLLCLLMLALGAFTEAEATHIRAGDITAKRDTTPNPNPRRFFFTMTIYRNTASNEKNLTVDIATGERGEIIKVDVASIEDIGNQTERWVYIWEHTYSSDGSFTTSWNGINRNGGILNIAPPSQQVTFFIYTTININALRGFNSTPMLTVAPVDIAAVGRRFVHNPGAYDADGDSLAFKLVVPRRVVTGTERIEDVPGYSLPHLTFRSANCTTSDGSGPATLSLDPLTGQLTWDSPCVKGEYNVAFVVEEWRVSPNGGAVKLGEVVRDMQILVRETPNRPPVLAPRDTCVVAGALLRGTVRATDPDNDLINLTVAGSGIVPPATFSQTVRQPGLAAGVLAWQTACADVRARPYQVVFRAEDARPPGEPRLTDVQPWNIKVVGPAPENLDAAAGPGRVTLSWDPYTCANASTVRIYRREGPSGFVPGPCETGVPASTGYALIGEVEASETGFVDNTAQAGVEYCYIVYAAFPSPGLGESLASNEACVGLERDVPYLTNVTVEETDASAGSILVRWTQPETGALPLEYRLLRKAGQGAGTGFEQVFSSTDRADTTYIDKGLNTLEEAYRYRLELYLATAPGGAPAELREGAEASSVRLEVTPAAGEEASFGLAWTYQVPWDNAGRLHRIYRREAGGPLVLIDSVSAGASGGSYTDSDAALARGTDYCYVVETVGAYPVAGLPSPLLNRSQEACARLPLQICPPELSVNELDCEAFLRNPQEPPYQNVLTWAPQAGGGCTEDIAFYTVYFKATLEGEYAALGTTEGTTFTHAGLESFAGCYRVTATDGAGRESDFSNEVCKDNCLFFMLPNIITPNGDGANDVFRPAPGSAFIRSMKFKVLDRWGVKVYELDASRGGDALYINWGGVDQAGNRLPDGTYYYQAEVEFHTLDPKQARQTYKGWVEINR